MNEIIKQAEPITLMCNVKRAIELHERVCGCTPEVSINNLMDLCAVETQADFEQLCIDIEADIIARVACVDASRQNEDINLAEIPNDLITECLMDAFERIWEIPVAGPVYITVDNLHNEAFFFYDVDDMWSFVYNYEVTPYSAYEVKNNVSIRIREAK